MADDKKPIQPKLRKKTDQDAQAEAEAAEGAESVEDSSAEKSAAERPAVPEDAAQPAGEADVDGVDPDAPVANPELSSRFDGDKPVPGLTRRVVDMDNYKKPPKPTKEGPAPVLVEKEEEAESPTSPERPSVKPAQRKEEPTVRVEDASFEDFEAMLAESGGPTPPTPRVSVGDKFDGTISSIGRKWIYIDMGSGLEGLARIGDFTDKQGELTLAVGETHSFYVLGTGDGAITLGDQLSTREAAMDAVYTAERSGVPLTGRVAEKNKGGFVIDLGGVRAFCPISQIELAFTEDADQHLGNSYKFRVTEVREGGDVVVSRAALMKEEQEAAAKNAMESLEPGMVVDGTVTRLADFGAFIDIGGIEGLAHISELGFSHVDHPSEVLKEGEKVKVKILNFDEDERGLRIGLSLKEAMEDPWETAIKTVFSGAQVEGKITRLADFGAFVEVAPNVEGLVHVSELSWDHVKRPSDVVSVGQRVTVEVQDVDLPRRRISLSMKGAAGNPWSNVAEKFQPGDEVAGTVENVEDFGAFVQLGGGITALIPRSEMGLSSGGTPHSKYSKGEEVTARVLNVDVSKHRMSLTTKSAEEVADSADVGPRSYQDKPSGTDSGLGTLGDLFKDKFK